MSYTTPINLTDEEWMSLINKERDGLPACCANISALRDCIIGMARDGQILGIEGMSYLRALRGCMDGHDMRGLSPALDKMSEQVLAATGVTWEELERLDHRDMVEGHVLDERARQMLVELLERLAR